MHSLSLAAASHITLYRSRSFVEGSDCARLTAEPCVVVGDAPHKREDAGTTNRQLFDQVIIG